MNLKKKLTAALAAVLALVALPVGALAAFSADLFKNPTYSLENKGFTYLEQEVTEGGLQKLFYGEYNATDPNAEYEWVIHSIRDGSKTTLTTVMDIAKNYEQTTGRKVMFAANGDYFDFGSGSNIESYVNNGVVVSKGVYAHKHCIGFDNTGKVVVGRMTEVERRLMVVLDGKPTFLPIHHINEEPGENEISIYISPGTYTITGAGKYVCATDATNMNNFPVYGTSRRMSTGTVTNDDAFTLRSGQFAVVVKGEHAQFLFDKVVYGVEVNLVELPAGAYAGCTWVLGGYDILVDNGTVNTNCHTDNSGNANAPRTFIGFKEDGTGFVCVVDGRGAGGSVGITVNKEAQLAQALGAKFALELDGGGSSTAIVRIDDTLTLRNKPSDGSMRRVSNAIMLVEKEKVQEPETPPTAPTDPTTPATQPTAPATKPATPTQPGVNPTAVVAIAVMGGLVSVAVIALIVLAVVKRKK